MNFNWSNFQTIADELAKRDDETAIRSAISRYYYAVFGYARLYLIDYKNRQSLADVKNILEYSPVETESEIGENLNEMRKLRNDADYDWKKDKRYFKKEIKWIKKKSHDCLNSIEYLKNNHPIDLK